MKKILSGQIALIFGSSGGIGKEIAGAFATQGANLILCSRNIDKLKKQS